MNSTRITAFVFALIVMLPLVLVSVNTFNAELDIELIESLAQEENDEKDGEGEYMNYFFIPFSISESISEAGERQLKKFKSKTSLKLQANLAFKVPTPPPEHAKC